MPIYSPISLQHAIMSMPIISLRMLKRKYQIHTKKNQSKTLTILHHKKLTRINLRSPNRSVKFTQRQYHRFANITYHIK